MPVYCGQSVMKELKCEKCVYLYPGGQNRECVINVNEQHKLVLSNICEYCPEPTASIILTLVMSLLYIINRVLNYVNYC